MQAYKYDTRISDTGLIQIPLNADLLDREVEIIILPKHDKLSKKKLAGDFIDKWSGFLSDIDIDEAKYNYLSEKYS